MSADDGVVVEATHVRSYIAGALADADEAKATERQLADNLCSACGTAGATHACSACNVTQYCNAACQEAHWVGEGIAHAHKDACALLAKVTAAIEDEAELADAGLSAAELAELGLDAATVGAEQRVEAPANAGEAHISAWLWDPFTSQWYWTRGGARARIYWSLWGWRPWWWRPWVFVGRGRNRRRVRRRRGRGRDRGGIRIRVGGGRRGRSRSRSRSRTRSRSRSRGRGGRGGGGGGRR